METHLGNLDRNRLKAVLVDDDLLLGEFLGLQLESLGCATTVVDDGQDALEVLVEGEVDVLITDWQMPGMDGMEVVRRARLSRGRDSYLHIVMMTARGEEAVIREALRAGVDDFLFKPVQPVELELAIETARRNRLLHRRLERRNELLSIAHRRASEALDRVRADLDAATALHERLLPTEGSLGGLQLSRLYHPAAMLGGDSIGVSPLRDGGLLFFLIDVKGHGVPAALDSFHLHHRIKQLRPTRPEELGEALAIINREILDRGDESYATVVCGLVAPETREGWLVCAGHPPPLLAFGASVELLEGSRCHPVGWFPASSFEPARFEFPHGARLVLYSDGVTDCSAGHGRLYGVEGMERVLAGTAGGTLVDFVGALEKDLMATRSAAGFEDDVSLLAIENLLMETAPQ